MTNNDEAAPRRGVGGAARRGIVTLEVPGWLRTLGVGAWLVLGLAGVLALALLLIALITEVAIPLAIAAVLAAILVPLTDRLQRWRVPRWLGATLVLILGLTIVVATGVIVVSGLTSQSDEIWAQVEDSLQHAQSQTSSEEGTSDDLVSVSQDAVHMITFGVLGSLFSSLGSLVVGAVLAIFVLLFLLKDWDQITGWAVHHVGLAPPVAGSILDGTVQAFRGYAAGLTIIGAANALVVWIGALLLGVPLAGTIALVSFITSYVPYLGAFAAGAFAVVIAYGSGGIGVALGMLALVLLANNMIQNLVEPFAFGTRLRLHPLAVLLVVTTATLLFGLMGAILAAPLTSAGVSAYHRLKEPATAEATGDPDRGSGHEADG